MVHQIMRCDDGLFVSGDIAVFRAIVAPVIAALLTALIVPLVATLVATLVTALIPLALRTVALLVLAGLAATSVVAVLATILLV